MLQALPAVESLPDTLGRIRFSVFMGTHSAQAAAPASEVPHPLGAKISLTCAAGKEKKNKVMRELSTVTIAKVKDKV